MAITRELRPAYGFDDVALVPGQVTCDPADVEIGLRIGDLSFSIPILAAAMDAIVDPAFAVRFGKLGGLAVMNLEGVQTRYERPAELLAQVAESTPDQATALLQRIYAEPIKPQLVAERIAEIKAGDVPVAVSVTPLRAGDLGPVAVEAGASVLFVQSTVTTARFISKSQSQLSFASFCKSTPIPVVVGNCVGYDTSMELLEAGIAGLLVGVGPGAACTSREVLGIGVPQVTATLECQAARDAYFEKTGRYVVMITDGGMRTGGDIAKAIASGADAVMLGSPFAQAAEAPGRGHNWGMATPHAALPRGTRVKVGVRGSLEQILFGPTSLTDGTQNFVSALRMSMGMCGALTIQDMHRAQIVLAPSIKTEGKLYQLAGMR